MYCVVLNRFAFFIIHLSVNVNVIQFRSLRRNGVLRKSAATAIIVPSSTFVSRFLLLLVIFLLFVVVIIFLPEQYFFSFQLAFRNRIGIVDVTQLFLLLDRVLSYFSSP